MKKSFLLSFVTGALVLLASHSAAVEIGFGEVDYSENEATGSARVVVTKTDENREPVSLTVTSMTLDEYFAMGKTLSSEFNVPPVRASYDPDGRKDFERTSVDITFPPSGGSRDLEVTIPLIDDDINEANEGFIVIVQPNEDTVQESSEEITFIRDGATIVKIVDDDPIEVGFEKREYTVSEGDGTLTETVYITKGGQESELNISVVVQNSRSGVATEGDDYNFDDPITVIFTPDDDRIPVPVTLLQDDIAEDREQFNLFLGLNQGSPGQRIGTSSTFLIINDDDIVVIDFKQPEYVVNEGDGSVDVCIEILEPEELDIYTIFGTVSTTGEDADVGEDFNAVDDFFDLYPQKREHCFKVPIIDDPNREPNETLVLQLIPDSTILPPNVQFQRTNVTITIMDNDGPEEIPTTEAVVPTTETEAPTTKAEASTTVSEVPTTEAEVPTIEAEVPTTETEAPEDVLVDECATNTHDCDQYAECVDLVDGYQCTCLPGFTGDGHICFEIDECCENTHECDSNAKCHNTVGSYMCMCNSGYSGDGFTCQDIDECTSDKTNNCSPNAHCINVPGTYFCFCKLGFTGDGTHCTKLLEQLELQEPSECTPATQATDCPSRSTCQNGVCVCRKGYERDGKNCKDINECRTGSAKCSEGFRCVNRRGSYYCRDINECVSRPCGNNAICSNTRGSYTCTCRSGFSGNGKDCARARNRALDESSKEKSTSTGTTKSSSTGTTKSSSTGTSRYSTSRSNRRG